MKQFKYKSITSAGVKYSGVMTAAAKEDVVKNLQATNQIPVEIQEVSDDRDIKLADHFKKVKSKDLALFCKQLYTLLNAGVTLINSLNILKVQTENKKLRVVVTNVYDHLQKGLTFSESLQENKDVFPSLMINMVQAGEVSGNLDTVLDRLSLHYEKEHAINSKIKSAMVYPAFIAGLTVVVVTFLITFILPTFMGMFTSAGVELPGLTKMMLGISDFIKTKWYVIIIVIFAFSYFVKKFTSTENGQMTVDRLKMRLPVFKGMFQKMYTTRFSRTLATLISSGIPLIQALETVAKVLGNKPAEQAVMGSIDDVRKGVSLSVPIKNSELFPPMVHYMLSIGEETGAMDTLMDKTANYFDQELDESIKRVMALIEPMLIVLMAVIVGFVIISIALPMFDMVKLAA